MVTITIKIFFLKNPLNSDTQCELSAGRCKRSSDVLKQAMLIPLATFSASGLGFNDRNELGNIIECIKIL